jgi:peptide/nickel transport system permease protein
MGGALLAISAPVYWLGLVALYLFAKDIGVVPILPGAGSYVGITKDPAGWLGSLLLPWLVLAAGFAAFYARLLRSSLVEVMSEDYIRTARAKGLPERRVIWHHGVRAAITPIVTVLGLDVGILLGGSVLTETVFNIPGIGRYAYEAIPAANLPAIQGTVLFGAFFIIVANLVVDIAYTFLDPRVRYA